MKKQNKNSDVSFFTALLWGLNLSLFSVELIGRWLKGDKILSGIFFGRDK